VIKLKGSTCPKKVELLMSVFKAFSNQIIIPAFLAWAIAQLVKVPIEYLTTREWNWSLLLSAGGMPSSHSALIAAMTHALGLFYGFDSPFFAIGFVLSMIVIYDATGIRRQAGKHAVIINKMITDLALGNPLKEQEQLREELGHTLIEAIGGLVLGIVTAQTYWFIKT
jgi:acid phosphatase family membrane protein YuiD